MSQGDGEKAGHLLRRPYFQHNQAWKSQVWYTSCIFFKVIYWCVWNIVYCYWLLVVYAISTCMALEACFHLHLFCLNCCLSKLIVIAFSDFSQWISSMKRYDIAWWLWLISLLVTAWNSVLCKFCQWSYIFLLSL